MFVWRVQGVEPKSAVRSSYAWYNCVLARFTKTYAIISGLLFYNYSCLQIPGSLQCTVTQHLRFWPLYIQIRIWWWRLGTRSKRRKTTTRNRDKSFDNIRAANSTAGRATTLRDRTIYSTEPNLVIFQRTYLSIRQIYKVWLAYAISDIQTKLKSQEGRPHPDTNYENLVILPPDGGRRVWQLWGGLNKEPSSNALIDQWRKRIRRCPFGKR